LERRGEIGAPGLDLLRCEIAHPVDQSGLQATEAEVEAPAAHRDGEVERLRVSPLRGCLDGGTARIPEAEQPCALVGRLPGSIVERLAARLEATQIANPREERVAAAGDQAEEGRFERLRLEVVGR